MSVAAASGELHRTRIHNDPGPGGNVTQEVDATEDRRIRGIHIVVQVDTGLTHGARTILWMGGSQPSVAVDSNDDDSGNILTHNAVITNDPTNGVGLAAGPFDHWVEFPGENYIDWSEGETFNAKTVETQNTGNGITAVIDVYYEEA